MASIPGQRAILDRAALNAALDEAVSAARSAAACRTRPLGVLKDANGRGNAEIRRRFDSGETSGEDTARARSFLIDQLIRAIYDLAAQRIYPAANPTAAEHQCLTAVGGYGRGELAPHSDIDCCSWCPTNARRGSSRSSNTCSTCSGTWG